MIPPDDPARDVYIGLLKKAKRIFVPGKGNVLYFPESDFRRIVQEACNRIIIHLPPPEIDYRDAGGQSQSGTQQPRPQKTDFENIVSALVNLGYKQKEAEEAASNARGKTLEDKIASALRYMASG